MRGHPVPLSCYCPACRLEQAHTLLVSGRTEAARLALEEVTRAIRRERSERCTGSIPWPEPPRAA
jgi:hypothetical protein